MLNAIKAFVGKFRAKPAPRAIAPLKHFKHIRVTYWTRDITVSYYDESGRKRTTRRYPDKDCGRVIKSARAKGYWYP